VARKYLNTSRLSFSACLAEIDGALTTGGVLGRAER
jgi:hypothetical protein